MSPPKYCFVTSSTRLSICAGVTSTPSLSASLTYSSRCTRYATAWFWSAVYSEVPALGNARFCDWYDFSARARRSCELCLRDDGSVDDSDRVGRDVVLATAPGGDEGRERDERDGEGGEDA